MNETRCSACGKPMGCGRDDPAGCWCARLPPLPAAAIVAGRACLCEDCLRRSAATGVPEPRSGKS